MTLLVHDGYAINGDFEQDRLVITVRQHGFPTGIIFVTQNVVYCRMEYSQLSLLDYHLSRTFPYLEPNFLPKYRNLFVFNFSQVLTRILVSCTCFSPYDELSCVYSEMMRLSKLKMS